MKKYEFLGLRNPKPDPRKMALIHFVALIMSIGGYAYLLHVFGWEVSLCIFLMNIAQNLSQKKYE